jgi:hypothetical protein
MPEVDSNSEDRSDSGQIDGSSSCSVRRVVDMRLYVHNNQLTLKGWDGHSLELTHLHLRGHDHMFLLTHRLLPLFP